MRLRLALSPVLLLLLVACGNEGPRTLQPAADPVAGTRRVTCEIHTHQGTRRLGLDLPAGFVKGLPEGYDDGPPCAWHKPVQVPDDGDVDGDPATQDTYRSDVVLTLEHVKRGATLQDEYDEREPDAVRGETPEGDDSILYLRLAHDAPVFGRTVGERLSYLCYCDGQNLVRRAAQADGVRLEWSSEKPIQRETDRELLAILASIGTVA